MQISSAKDLAVYGEACELAMKIFELTKNFPATAKTAKLILLWILQKTVVTSRTSNTMNLRPSVGKSERCWDA
jgi:hypothetical protein